ncbi:hypothetical protein LINPERPRIM_LOCUS1755 [Linum perenne]
MIVALKLDGLITSHSSSSIYLVFENMEHDITGLLSCPDVSFSESQGKQKRSSMEDFG